MGVYVHVRTPLSYSKAAFPEVSVSSAGSNLQQYLVAFESPGLRRGVVSNRAVSVHALPLILSRLLAPPITSYSRLPVPLLSGGRQETGASASCLFTLLIAPVVSFH